MVGEVLEEGRERESFPLLLFILGERFFFAAFTHLVEGDLLLSFSFIGQRNLSSLLHSFGRGRSSAFVFFHWVEESFFPASHIW
mgnify:CR=1 FL=1